MKSQVFKTESFFIGKRHEKKMHFLNIRDLVVNKVIELVDQNISEDLVESLKIKRKAAKAQKQRNRRKAKKTKYYTFWLFENDFDYKEIDNKENSNWVELRKNELRINEDLSGNYHGSEIKLLDYLKSLYLDR